MISTQSKAAQNTLTNKFKLIFIQIQKWSSNSITLDLKHVFLSLRPNPLCNK